MTPSYFGPSSKQLLGIHHPPKGPAKQAGVVLCAPAPQEYMRSHWAYRKLADLLAKSGFEVFRFDYSGTGDSWGDNLHASVQGWVDDVRVAVKELKDITGVRRVSAVGMRVGAAIAAQASEGLNLERLVLWEPVVDGNSYLNDLLRVQRDLHKDVIAPPSPDVDGRMAELLGFTLSHEHEHELRQLNLNRITLSAKHIAVVTGEAKPEYQALVQALVSKGLPAKLHVEHAESVAGKAQAQLLGNEALNRINACLTEPLS